MGTETYAYRRFGNASVRPLLFLQHFMGTLDNWDFAVTDPLASEREVILFHNADVGALGEFVRSLAHRIASFPAVARHALRERVNAITLAAADDFRRDSDLFGDLVRTPEAQTRTQAAMKCGFQTRDGELALGATLSELG